MSIEGRIVSGWLPFIYAKFICDQLQVNKDILLVVDTGTAITTINEFDARQMKVDYSKLKRKQDSLGIGGSAESYVADSCHLYFGEGIESVDVEPVKFLRQLNVDKADQERYPSLLGMDVLINYRISFTESKVILEKIERQKS
ncbi:MAG TPA: retropepsin-like aspartic protease [Anaerolineales bacterium]|nr:retropepsin-like aspartic protease [Anaerolineales bacterium]